MARPSEHLPWIDWLKVILVLGVCYYHTAQVFTVAGWLIQDQERSLALSAFAGFGYLFGLPLLFMLSGAAAWFALETRTASAFAVQRVQRLLPPIVLGFLLISPLQAWLAAVNGGSQESLAGFAPQWFAALPIPTGPVWLGVYGYHLWFIGFLFLYGILSLPALVWLRSDAGRRYVRRLATPAGRVAAAIGLVTILVVAQVALRPFFPVLYDWADFLLGLGFVVAGAVLVADRRFGEALARRRLSLLALALAASAGLFPFIAMDRVWEFERLLAITPEGVAYLAVRSVATTAWVLAVIGFAIRYLTRRTAALDYASDAVLPFYVLHHPIVVAIAVVAITWPVGLWAKHIVIVAGSFGATWLLYEYGVRRVGPMRVLFGLRPASPPAVESVPPDVVEAPAATS
jgi:surface polysaccharide O-acyltransferase-like enzyme